MDVEGKTPDVLEDMLETITKTPCWVCGNINWMVARNNESFGAMWPGLKLDQSDISTQHMRVIVLLCGRCATIWPLGLNLAQDIYGTELPDVPQEGEADERTAS